MSKANIQMVLDFINEQPLLNDEPCDDDIPDLVDCSDYEDSTREIEPYTVEYEDYGIDMLDISPCPDLLFWKGL